ncbi:MAG: hypothetical protein KBB71_03980 [Lentimicrobiaceae bacterium]|nr:hypothetical protein [Lentimicrobiaceae bacterium]
MIKKANRLREKGNMILLLENIDQLPVSLLTGEEYSWVKDQKEKQEKDLVVLNRYDHFIVVQFIKKETSDPKRWENCRIAGDRIGTLLNENRIREVVIYDVEGRQEETLALAEGMELGNYQFLTYKKEPVKKRIHWKPFTSTQSR